MNWKEKGRAAANLYSWGWCRRADALLKGPAADIESKIRHEYADLLAAVRDGAERTARNIADTGYPLSVDYCTNIAEAEALRLLTEGFRERLAEIGEGKP